MKRGFLLLLMAIAACVSTAALAHGNVGVYVGAPGPVYAAPPPIFYRNFWAPAYQAYPPPVVYQSPPLCMDSHRERMVGVDTAAVGIASGTTMVGKGAGNIIVMEMTTDNWRSPAPIVFSLFRRSEGRESVPSLTTFPRSATFLIRMLANDPRAPSSAGRLP